MKRLSVSVHRKLLVGIVLCIAVPIIAWAQWGGSTDIYNTNSGKVGIGTTSPGSLLFVGSGSVGSGPLPGLNVAVGGNSYVAASDGTRTAFLGADSSGYGMVGTLTNHDFVIRSSNNERIRVSAAGNVGIGTSYPSSGGKLTLDNGGLVLTGSQSSELGTAVGLIKHSSGPTVLYYGTDRLLFKTDSGASGDRVAIDANGRVGIGTNWPSTALHVVGDVTITGNISAKYQDIAEWVPASESIPVGSVVVLDKNRDNGVVLSSSPYDTHVAGVISDSPGLVLGESSPDKVRVATTGRVRVRVDASHGEIHRGDLLVTSDKPGMAMKSVPVTFGGVEMHRPGTLIGKALEPLSEGEGEILVLLSLQ